MTARSGLNRYRCWWPSLWPTRWSRRSGRRRFRSGTRRRLRSARRKGNNKKSKREGILLDRAYTIVSSITLLRQLPFYSFTAICTPARDDSRQKNPARAAIGGVWREPAAGGGWGSGRLAKPADDGRRAGA